MSPHFLFRVEDDPKNPNDVRTLNDFEFATRLCYFLWSSMPDEELFALAEQGRTPQAGRARSASEADAQGPESAGAVGELRRAVAATPQPQDAHPGQGLLPSVGRRPARRDGPRDGSVLRVRRAERPPILDFLDADYTFVNERLAKHYGISDVTGRSSAR